MIEDVDERMDSLLESVVDFVVEEGISVSDSKKATKSVRDVQQKRRLAKLALKDLPVREIAKRLGREFLEFFKARVKSKYKDYDAFSKTKKMGVLVSSVTAWKSGKKRFSNKLNADIKNVIG